MKTIIVALLISVLAAVSLQSCVIGGDEPWDAEGSDTDTDTDSDGDGDGDTDTDTGTDTDLDDNDAGADGGADAG